MASPFAEPGVTAAPSPGRGVGVVTSRRVGKGRLIASAKTPTAYVLDPLEVQSRCYGCCGAEGEQCAELKTCTGCRYARFCSRACQRASWTDHKLECKSFQKLGTDRRPPSLLLLLARLLRARAAGTIDRAGLAGLAHHREDIADADKERFAELLLALKTGIALDGEEFDMQSAMTLLCQIGCNSFSLCDAELQSIGTAVYADIAAFNHSCRPNCAAIFDGKALEVRTIRAVPAGAELTISYVDVRLPATDRRAALKKQFHFDCDCERCATWSPAAGTGAGPATAGATAPLPAVGEEGEELDDGVGDDTALQLARRAGGRAHGDGERVADSRLLRDREKLLLAQRCPEAGCKSAVYPDDDAVGDDPAEWSYSCTSAGCRFAGEQCGERLIALTTRCAQLGAAKADAFAGPAAKLDLLRRELALRDAVLWDTHHAVVAALNGLVDACIALGEWQHAYGYAARAIKATVATVGPETPTVAIEFVRLGKLAHHLGELVEATKTFGAALSVLEVSHGPGHPLVRDLRMRLAQATGELNQQR